MKKYPQQKLKNKQKAKYWISEKLCLKKVGKKVRESNYDISCSKFLIITS